MAMRPYLGASFVSDHPRPTGDNLRDLPDKNHDQGAHNGGWDLRLAAWVTPEDLFRYPVRHFGAHAAEIRHQLVTCEPLPSPLHARRLFS
jgi:hypothetical protein